MKLTDLEKKYLWSKLEYTKKKKAIETQNDIYHFLNGERSDFNEDEFKKILTSLEYTFKNKLMYSDIDNENFKSIKNKLPKDWLGVTFRNIKAKTKRDLKEIENKKLKHLKEWNEFNL